MRAASFASFILVVNCALCPSKSTAQIQPAQILFSNTEQTFDSNVLLPTVSTIPAGLDVSLKAVPRISETVFNRIPSPLAPSYASYGMNQGSQKAYGDLVKLGGTDRHLESIDAVLVNWASASDFPQLAQLDPTGYQHFLTAIVYERQADQSFQLIQQSTSQIHVPWRPETLSDGSPYPFNGIAFKARVNFPGNTLVGNDLVILLSYNTSAKGFNPIGSPGPYDSLNFGLTTDPPLLGSDLDQSRMMIFNTTLGTTTSFGAFTPLFTVRAFPSAPANGDPQDAGEYLIRAEITSAGYEGIANVDFTIEKAPAAVFLSGLSADATASPQTPVVTTIPVGLATSVQYLDETSAPTDPGTYSIFARIDEPNYQGERTGLFTVNWTYGYWQDQLTSAGSLPLAEAGPNDDPDRDGITNEWEYLLALDPETPESEPLSINVENEVTQVTFSRRHPVSSHSIRLQVAEELGPLLENPWTLSNAHTTEASGAPGQIFETHHFDLLGSSPRFFRLQFVSEPAL